ncbi:MAG: hypothetical protein HY286_01460 [Planctomycetes bacterium]|nr:hypothetical protein [Planctomycetota bacterium]
MPDRNVPEPTSNNRTSNHPPRKFKRPRILLVLFFVVFAISFGVTLRFSLWPSAALTRFVNSELSDLFAPKVTIGDALLDFAGRSVVIPNVAIGDDPARPDLKISEVRVEFTIDPGGTDKFRVSKVKLIDAELHAEAIAKLFKNKSADSKSLARIPQIALERGRILVDAPAIGSMEFYDLSASLIPRENDELAVEGIGRTPLRGAVHVGGLINLKTGALDVRAESEVGIDLAAATREKLSPQIERWRRECQPAGLLNFFISMKRESENSPIATSAEVEINSLQCVAPDLEIEGRKISLKELLAAKEFHVVARLETDGNVRIHGEGKSLWGATVAALLDARVDLQTQQITAARGGIRVSELTLGTELQKLLDNIDDGVADAIRALHPEGPVDAAIFGTWDPITNKPDIHATVDLSHNTKVTFLGFRNRDKSVDASFPYPIQDLEGRISFRPGKVILAGIKGLMGQSGRIEGNGSVAGSGLVGLNIRVHGSGLPVDDSLKQAMEGVPVGEGALAEELKKDPKWSTPTSAAWQPAGLSDGANALSMFDLKGKFNFDVEVARPQGRRDADVVVRAWADGGATGAFEELPVRVNDLQGSVIFQKGFVRFGLDGSARGTRVRIEGSVDGRRDAAGAEPSRNGLALRVSARDFLLDPALSEYFSKCAPEARDFLREIEPTARCDFEYRGERPANAPGNLLESYLTIQCRDGSIQHAPGIGAHVESLAASLKFMTRAIDKDKAALTVWLDSIAAKYFGKPVFASGIFGRRDGEKPSLALALTAIGLPLENVLLDQLLRTQAPAAAAAVAKYQLSGVFDASVHHIKSKDADATDVSGTVRKATVMGPGLPGIIENVEGTIAIDSDGVLTSRRFDGKLNSTDIAIEQFEIKPARGAEPVTVSGRAHSDKFFDIMDLVRRAVPESPWIARMSLGLVASPRNLNWKIEIPEQGWPVLRANGILQISDGTVVSRGLLDKLSGYAEIEDLAFDANGFTTKAHGRELSMNIFGVRLNDAQGDVVITPERVAISDFDANCVGGRLTQRANAPEILTVDLTKKTPEWILRFSLDNADLSEVFRYVPKQTSGIKGRLQLALGLHGAGGNYLEYRGNGEMSAREANLFEVPGFKGVPDELKLKERPVFHDMNGKFTIGNARIDFSRLILESDDLELRGEGWVGFNTEILMTMLPRFLHIPIIDPIIKPFITFFQDRIVDVTVYGTLDNPHYQKNFILTRKPKQDKEVIAPEPQLELGERF